MRKLTLGYLIAALLAVWSQPTIAEDGTYTSRMDLYEAQARQYVIDRTQRVTPRTRYVQPRVVYIDRSPIRQRVVNYRNSEVRVVRNADYYTPATVTVIEDVVAPGREHVLDDVEADSGYVDVRHNYIQPAHYAGYNGYRGYRASTDYSYTSYRNPNIYRAYHNYPRHHRTPGYRVKVHYNHGYRHPSYRHGYRHGYGYGYGHYGGYYGHRGHRGHYRGHRGHYGHGSNWGFSVHFDF